jgi:hypothetical protein
MGQLDRFDFDQWIELADLEGATTRIKRTGINSGAGSNALGTIRNWRNNHDEMLEIRKAKPGLIKLYQQLAWNT